MLSLSRVLQASSDFIKILRYGKDDVLTASQYLPHGFDSKPLAETLALYSRTTNQGSLAVFGYLLKSDNTEPGESRMYAVNDNGAEVFYIHQKKDGTCEIGGSTDNFIRYIPLDSALQSFKSQISDELVKIQTGLAGVGGAYTPGTLSIDISAAKIDEVKSS